MISCRFGKKALLLIVLGVFLLFLTLADAPSVTLVSPLDTLSSGALTQKFISNVTDDIQLLNATLYIWDSEGVRINDNTDWTSFRQVGDTTRSQDWTAQADTTYNISQFVASYTTGGAIRWSSPAVSNGYVYVGSEDNKLYQLNATNVSQVIATYTTGDGTKTPAVSNGYVYVGSEDNKLYQLNATNISQMIATYTTGGDVWPSPAVSNGYVYVGSADNKLYQLNATNVSQVIATYTAPKSFYTAPVVYGDYVYSSTSAYGKLYQLNATNISQEIASYDIAGSSFSSPVASNGYLYITEAEGVLQLNATNVSELISTYDLGTSAAAWGSPAISNGYLYIGEAFDNVFHQLNASNVSQMIATYTTGGSIYSSPAVADGYVYFGCEDSKVYQLNASWFYNEQDLEGVSGEVEFEHSFSNYSTYEWNIYSCDNDSSCSFATSNYTLTLNYSIPTIELISPENNIYSSSFLYSFVANLTDDIQLLNSTLYIWDSIGDIVYGNTDWTSYMQTGDTVRSQDWITQADTTYNISQFVASYYAGSPIFSSPAVANGYVYVGSENNKLHQLNATNISQMIATYTTGGLISSSPAISNGYVYVGSYDNKLYQLNATNVSQMIATYTTGGDVRSSPTVSNGYVYVGSEDNKLYQLNATNISQMIATYTTGDQVLSSPAISNGYVYVGSIDNKLHQLNVTNISQMIATYTTGGLISSSPAISNGYVYVGSYDNKLYQLNATNVSQMIASYETSGDVYWSSPAVANGYVYVGSRDSKVYQLNATDISQMIASYETSEIVDSSPAVANGYVYVGSRDNKLYQLNATNISQMIATYTTGADVDSSPAVANGYVYVGSRDSKVYQLNASWIYDLQSQSISGVSNQTSFDYTLASEDTYEWNIYSCDNDSSCSFATVNHALTVDETAPVSTLISPTNNSFTKELVNNLIINSTDDTQLKNITYYIYNSTDSLINSYTASISGISEQSIYEYNFSVDGEYLFNTLVYDEAGNSYQSDNFTLNIYTDNPNIILNYPTNNSYLDNIEVTLNFTATHESDIDTCILWSNFNGTWQENGTLDDVTSGVEYSVYRNLTDEAYIWNVWCNNTLGNMANATNNNSFVVDSVNPSVNNITINVSSGSSQISFLINVTDDNLNATCIYNIYTADVPGANTTFPCNNQTITNAPGFGSYVFHLWAYDLAGNLNKTNTTFITSASSGGGGGGGGSTTVIIGDDGWTMETTPGSASYTLSQVKGTSRDMDIVFENKGSESRQMSLSCEDQDGITCKLISFEEKEFLLPLIKDIRTIKTFTITIPEENLDKQYSFNIIATDDLKRKGAISVSLSVGTQPALVETVSKLALKTPSGFPYIIIFLLGLLIPMILLGSFMPKFELKALVVIIISLFTATFSVYFL